MGTRLERMPLCSAIMQIEQHRAYFNIRSRGLDAADIVACASSESSRAVGNLPLTLSPVLPTLSASKGLGKSGFVTPMEPSKLQPPSVTKTRGCRGARARYNYYTQRKKPEYLQTHLRMRCIGDLKGQIRWFLTLSARSLPVFTEPNASPSVASVCPLLYPPPFLPLSFAVSPYLTPSLSPIW